jgi:hypothetical protein
MNNNENLVVQSKQTAVEYYTNNREQLLAFATTMIDSKYANLLKGTDGSINPNDVIACIITGNELGMTPMQSLRLADKLTNDGYLSILKGKELGIDPLTAVDNIYTITVGGKRSNFIGIHVVTKILRENNIDIKILLDNAPLYSYSSLIGAKFVPVPIEEVEDESFKLLDKFYIFILGITTPEEISQYRSAGKLPISRTEIGRRSAVELTRAGFSNVRYVYSTQDAINEGVYPGVNKFGEKIDGEGSWMKHTRSKMLKTCIERAARIIADDKLQGSYTVNEISQFVVNNNMNRTNPQIIEIQAKDESEVI